MYRILIASASFNCGVASPSEAGVFTRWTAGLDRRWYVYVYLCRQYRAQTRERGQSRCARDALAACVPVRKESRLDYLTTFSTLYYCTFSYHTWQFIIFTIFTITTCIFSYSVSVSFWSQDLALQQILSSIDLFLYYRTDYTDSRTI